MTDMSANDRRLLLFSIAADIDVWPIHDSVTPMGAANAEGLGANSPANNDGSPELNGVVPATTETGDPKPSSGVAKKRIDPVTAKFNRKHSVVSVGGRTLIAIEGNDGGVQLCTISDLHALYENERVPTPDCKRDEPASRRWMRDPARRTYPNGVILAPGGAPEGFLNLWRGWGVEPDTSGSCTLFLQHLREVVCQGDAPQFAYLISWMAHLVQHPEEKPGVGLVLRGGKGAGKDTVAEYLACMIGRRHCPTVSNARHITGHFNAHLDNALLLHVQEGMWAGDKHAEQQLKYLVTSPYIEIERKGIDSIAKPSVLRMFISANADWVVPASPDERRWAVFEVSDTRKGDNAYFAALYAEMHGTGPAALLHYLSTYDISDFKVRLAPETEGLRNQKLASLQNIELWWYETLERGTLNVGFDGAQWNATGGSIDRDDMRKDYKEWMRDRRYDGGVLTSSEFGTRLKKLVPNLKSSRPRCAEGRRWMYGLPNLAACRTEFEKFLRAAVPWEFSD